jgi:hypothetical protein
VKATDMDRTRVYCNVCRHETWHNATAEYQQSHYDDFYGFDRLLHGQILSCCGCEYLCFRLYTHPYEFEEDGKIEESIYPERAFTRRQRIYIFWALPREIQKLYEQTVEALDKDLCLLSAIGLRALIESIVIDRLKPTEYSSSIKSKIEALRKYFSGEVINTLQEFRFMGNQAVHSLQESDGGDIHRALNVIEDIIIFFYGIEDKVWLYQIGKEDNSST